VVDGLSLDMVLAGDRRRGVAWSTRPSRSASWEDGGVMGGWRCRSSHGRMSVYRVRWLSRNCVVMNEIIVHFLLRRIFQPLSIQYPVLYVICSHYILVDSIEIFE
jgi:hypothetical protein